MSGAFPVIRDADRVRRLAALPQVRPQALDRLRRAAVAVVGVGGLGTAAAPYLAAAGVGRLRLIDPDVVQETDLGRQILYGPADVGQPKVKAAAAALTAQAPATVVEVSTEALDAHNGRRLLEGVDVILDGLDEGRPRDFLNEYAVRTGTPVVFGGALGYEGQVVVVAPSGPCLHCLFGSVADAAADCAREGILGPLVGVVGALQAAEALKWVMGLGAPLRGRVLQIDLFAGATRVLSFAPRAHCPVCGGQGVPGARPAATSERNPHSPS